MDEKEIFDAAFPFAFIVTGALAESPDAPIILAGFTTFTEAQKWAEGYADMWGGAFLVKVHGFEGSVTVI